MKWLEDAEAALSGPIASAGLNRVYQIDSSEDIRLAYYRLAKIRDNRVYSWFRSLMEKQKRNPILVLSKTVVERALEGCHELISVMVTEELFHELRPLIEDRQMVEGIYIVSRPTYEAVVGLAVNEAQACAALIDLQPAKALLATAEAPAPSAAAALRGEQYLWQASCVFGADRRAAAETIAPPLLILDNVRSSDNVGVILRTAYSLGLRSVIVTRNSMAAIGCRAARTSMGALSFFAVYVTKDLVTTIEELKARGVAVIATSPRGPARLETQRNDAWALVVGNEEEGSSPAVMAAASMCVSIPQSAGDSLSVSVATGICLYALRAARDEQLGS